MLALPLPPLVGEGMLPMLEVAPCDVVGVREVYLPSEEAVVDDSVVLTKRVADAVAQKNATAPSMVQLSVAQYGSDP